MPTSILSAFCDMFRSAETDGNWPSQLISGKVVSLAKVPTPGSRSDFRPITVFGLLYRCWSSFHAKKALQCLDHMLPDTLYGSRQGCHASMLWTRLLWAIEWSYQNDVSLSGIVLDLQKAFNMLPRLAVFEIAAHVGLPTYMLLGWAGALAQMKRYFVIRHSLSEGVESTTGFPEGCGLSCVAMVLVDAVFHRWQEVFFPLCTVLTYVDDWQVLCSHPSLITGAQQQLDRFVWAMDLVVDDKKSYTWSVSAEGRKQLRTQHTPVRWSAKNLGAHVQFTKRHTNSALMDRVTGVQTIWPRLRLSACSYNSKIRALRVAAWPRALHAVASTTMSDAAFHGLRTGAMKGIDSDSAGANAWIQLGLIEHPSTDPQFWAIIETIRCIRECGDPAHVVSRLSSMAHGTDNLPSNGITATLLTRIQMLGWMVSPEGAISDFLGSFSLFSDCLSLLVLRAQWAWLTVVANNVTHRFGFRNLHWADPVDTRLWLRTLQPDDCRLFHKCLNGSHFTQDCTSHCQEVGTDQCPFCMCSDSRFHRFWVCEHFAHLRNSMSDGVCKLIPQLPEFLTCYGWSMKPHTLFAWYQMLSQIEQPADVIVQPMDQDSHFFTDGSCMNQAYPQVRVATWAVVIATSGSFQSQVVSSGPLPGILQSSYRAEIFAVWRALVAARHQKGRVFLWTACNAVIIRLRRLLAGRIPKINSAHFDLWKLIHDALQEFSAGQVYITKVAAHRAVETADSPVEEWCFWHNHIVDKAASHAQHLRPEEFWTFYSTHVNAVISCQTISRQIQTVLLKISQAVVRNQDQDDFAPREELCVTPDVPDDAWTPVPVLTIPAQAVRWYGDEMVRNILSWYWYAVWNSHERVQWVSQFQLYIDYMLCGETGPVKIDRWQMGHELQGSDLISLSFLVRVRWFSKVLRECLRHLQVAATVRYCRPRSEALMLHTACIAVPWCPQRLQRIDNWILTHCPGGIRRSSGVLKSLPYATKDEHFPAVVQTLV